MARSVVRLAPLFVALAAAPGCFFSARVARLSWPPPGELLAPVPPPSAPAVSLQKLEDARPEPRKLVGEVGLFGFPNVETADDVAAWATAALHDELQRRGLRVVEPGDGVPVVGGEVRLVWAWDSFLYRGAVTLRAWARSADDVACNAYALGKGTGGLMLFTTSAGYTRALTSALRDASRQVATEVADAMARGAFSRRGPDGAAVGAAALHAPPPPEAPPFRGRSDWYLGGQLTLGFVDGQVADGRSGTASQGGQVLPLPSALQIGAVVGRRLLVGGEGSVTYGLSYADREVLLSQALATATLFPLEWSTVTAGGRELAPRGWYVRGGAGLAHLWSKPADDAPSGTASWNVVGPSISAATGWAHWIGWTQTSTVNVEVDFGWQLYGARSPEPQRSSSVRMSIGFVTF